jgi:hypothetical protein
MNIILGKDWQSCNSSAMAKKRFGQRTQGETTNTRKRAAARIALTCLVGQWRHAGVRIFYENCGIGILPMRDTLKLQFCLGHASIGGFVADLLEKRFELALLQGGEESGIIGLDLQVVDCQGQLHGAVEFDHLSIPQDLVAGVE